MNEWSDENIARGILALVPSEGQLRDTINSLQARLKFANLTIEQQSERIADLEAQVATLTIAVQRYKEVTNES